MTYGRLLERHLKPFGQARATGSALAFTEWPTLVQDRAGWRKLVTRRLFGVGKPRVRPPRCDGRVSPENIRRLMAQLRPQNPHSAGYTKRICFQTGNLPRGFVTRWKTIALPQHSKQKLDKDLVL